MLRFVFVQRRLLHPFEFHIGSDIARRTRSRGAAGGFARSGEGVSSAHHSHSSNARSWRTSAGKSPITVSQTKSGSTSKYAWIRRFRIPTMSLQGTPGAAALSPAETLFAASSQPAARCETAPGRSRSLPRRLPTCAVDGCGQLSSYCGTAVETTSSRKYRLRSPAVRRSTLRPIKSES